MISPDWPAPDCVQALVTTRRGGVSQAPFNSFNLGLHVQDNLAHVQQNRQQLQHSLATRYEPQWLQQVHGIGVVAAKCGGPIPEADACFTDQQGLPCAVMTADCLPVFFCTRQGDQVAAAHAGWRGLADGVLEATLDKLRAMPSDVLAWFGPAIGPHRFEVGSEVRDVFVTFSDRCAEAFIENPDKPGHWFADIYQLARIRLQLRGVEAIYGGDFCTYSDSERFFSYRRDGVTGRMASLIWISS
ncbi:MAG: peptidoglycan editing factor PgeF [Pseudomonadales bacterium]